MSAKNYSTGLEGKDIMTRSQANKSLTQITDSAKAKEQSKGSSKKGKKNEVVGGVSGEEGRVDEGGASGEEGGKEGGEDDSAHRSGNLDGGGDQVDNQEIGGEGRADSFFWLLILSPVHFFIPSYPDFYLISHCYPSFTLLYLNP